MSSIRKPELAAINRSETVTSIEGGASVSGGKPAAAGAGGRKEVANGARKGKDVGKKGSGLLGGGSGGRAQKGGFSYGRKEDERKDNDPSLRPRPSDSPLDPLNWPLHKKDLTFFSLLLATSVISTQRLQFAPVTSVLATQFSVSPIGAAILSGIPFIACAISSPFWSICKSSVGSRGIYILAALLMLAAQLWNMHVQGYGQFVGGRVLLGVGWGAFEGVADGLRGVYFEHQLTSRLSIFHASNIFFTWGTPILGGYLSQNIEGYGNEIMIMNVIQAVSILLLIVATPEIAFDRSSPASGSTVISTAKHSNFTHYLKNYLSITQYLRLTRHQPRQRWSQLFNPYKAFLAPTTALTFLLSVLPISFAYTFAFSLSPILSSAPLFIFPRNIGFTFAGPFILALVAFGIFVILYHPFSSIPTKARSSSKASNKSTNSKSGQKHKKHSSLKATIPGLVLFFIGTIVFTQYVAACLAPQFLESEIDGTVVLVQGPAMDINLKIVSLLLGVLVAGGTIMAAAVNGVIKDRNIKNAENAIQDLFTGIVVSVGPAWISDTSVGAIGGVEGLRDMGLGVGVVTAVVGGVGVAALWIWGGRVQDWDERVMGSGSAVLEVRVEREVEDMKKSVRVAKEKEKELEVGV